MVELNYSKLLTWKDINNILKLAENDIVIVKFCKSVANHPKMQYKLQKLKQNPKIIIDITTNPRGRPKKINEQLKQKIIELLKEGYSYREISKMLNIPKSTIFDSVKEFSHEIKIEQLNTLLWEFKEHAIYEGWYDNHAKALFLELEAHIKCNNLEKAYEVLQKIIEYRNGNIDD